MTKIDYKNLGFGYIPTKTNIRVEMKNSDWGVPFSSTDENISIHMASTCINYGQQCFEGMKAFRGKDEKIRLFRWEENWKRINASSSAMEGPVIPKELFFSMLEKVIHDNSEYIPAYESGNSLYIRPLLLGVGPQVGLSPSDEYMFIIYVNPVGDYIDPEKANKFLVDRAYDRAAPLGTGAVKLGGNYAGSLGSMKRAKEQGFASTIYLDAKEKKYIDECGPANFFAFQQDTFVTPKSSSILPSITNNSLQIIAQDLGFGVENRKVTIEELKNFEEAGACGTAAVITPIGQIFDPLSKIWYQFGDGENVGEKSQRLRKTLLGIQKGDMQDIHNWITVI
ncbi:MAG: branched-chain amino acid aminotransferase [Candidatus Gracilibacteria bacterium]|nr:branched-chain amino acid aminotransferase [Candidatus Gracilibacteria bacterium]